MSDSLPKSPYERAFERAALAGLNPKPVAEVGIPMRDGIELAADVYFPEESLRPAPVIMTMTPYDKSGSFIQYEGKFYQDHGYVYVAVDCRGRGKSEGEWRAFFNDGPDGHDAVEWLAKQSWSNGKIGTTGLSYMGWTQWATAAELPDHLVTMVSTSAAGRWMREIPYTDGCFQLYFGWWVFMVRRRIIEAYALGQHVWDEKLRMLPLEAIGEFINPSGQTWRDLMDHDRLDSFWDPIRFEEIYQKMTYPTLHVTGWYD
ncbi:MAG: CocE/NonD family hydrolase, partial [Thermomicrobiales bacterium]|nr:CocE/NonD family hydrolase [Thermomicrobiales bacterium]